MPNQQNFTLLMLLVQERPQFVLPCSTTHMDLHLGTMIRDMEYGTSNTFDKYMGNGIETARKVKQKRKHQTN